VSGCERLGGGGRERDNVSQSTWWQKGREKHKAKGPTGRKIAHIVPQRGKKAPDVRAYPRLVKILIPAFGLRHVLRMSEKKIDERRIRGADANRRSDNCVGRGGDRVGIWLKEHDRESGKDIVGKAATERTNKRKAGSQVQ